MSEEWDTLDLYCGGEERGRVLVAREGPRREVRVSMEKREDGIYRAYLLGERGELALGVLAPEGRRMTLCRWLYSRDLEALGTLRRGEARCSRSFFGGELWERVPPERAGEISPLLRGEGPLWRRKAGERTLAALPWDKGQPFPLPGLFCMAAVGQVEGRSVVIYAFDAKGSPQTP